MTTAACPLCAPHPEHGEVWCGEAKPSVPGQHVLCGCRGVVRDGPDAPPLSTAAPRPCPDCGSPARTSEAKATATPTSLPAQAPRCSITATIGAVTKRCGNDAGHVGDCWFLPDRSLPEPVCGNCGGEMVQLEDGPDNTLECAWCDGAASPAQEATPPRYVTFAELVEYGRQHGANIVNGMPWSFTFNGVPITHENDECYLVNTRAGTQRFTPRDTMQVGPEGQVVVIYAAPSPLSKEWYLAAADRVSAVGADVGAGAAPTPEASDDELLAKANLLVGGDLRRMLPGEIVAAYERCREYIVMPRQGTEYGLFSAKADLWRVVTYAATVAALEETLTRAGYERCVGPAGWKPPVNHRMGELWRKLLDAEATVAALTAERDALNAKLHQQDNAGPTNEASHG